MADTIETIPANLWVTGTAAVNTALTVTLPAAAGLFHYIVKIELIKLYSVVGVASGSGVIVTSTNLNSAAWTTEQNSSAAGTCAKVVDYAPCVPIKSAVVNTATTFVAPAQLQTIWRWNVVYYLGP